MPLAAPKDVAGRFPDRAAIAAARKLYLLIWKRSYIGKKSVLLIKRRIMRKPSIETIANIAVILVAILVATVFVKNNFIKSAPAPRQSMVGQTIKLDGIDAHAANVTVLLALSSSCRFCDASSAFYQRLTALRRDTGNKFQTVGVFRESVESAQEYLTKKGLIFDGVISNPTDDLKVHGTPTMLMVNSEGKVIKEWVGLMDDTEQKEAIDLLRTS